ncbi:GNAT family N-acetyltransferase [Micromonospora sp. NPDC005215]|uniref:GNAT family N-acetyltransferase n=1 Tax=Micromonospora sp. NPDC005215 TaxID=3157024 RepID=UPI0033B33173
MTPPTVDTAIGRIELRDLNDQPDLDLLRRAYDDILVPSFPAHQLDDLEVLAGSSETFVGVAVHDAAPVGVIVAEPIGGVLLLSYLAVRPGTRSGGIGGLLVGRLLPAWRERSGADVVLAEVEDPRLHPAGEFGDPAARLRFYQRAGFGMLPVPFAQPRLRPDALREPGMLLAVQPCDAAVPKDLVTSFLVEYFESAEGLEVHDDPEFNALVAVVERQGPALTPLALDQHPTVPPLDVAAELLRRDYPTTASALDLLATDGRAGPVLDDVWAGVLARLVAGERLPRPGVVVVAALLDALSDAGLLFVSSDPVDADVLQWWFLGEDDPWAGWWRKDPPSWDGVVPSRPLVALTVRRLPPLPRVAVILSDVLGVAPAEAAALVGHDEQAYLELLGAARTEVVALIDRQLDKEESGGHLPAM